MIADPLASHNNLPAYVSSFIGRERDLTEINGLLRQRRLLTLTGPGGAGKTRLAVRAAASEIDFFPDGVWLVALAPLTRPELVAETIARILKVPASGEQAALDNLSAFLATKHLLIVLDNCEHLLAECAHVVARLLAGCPSLVVLATSREPLMIGGEWVLRVAPLDVPPLAESYDKDDIERLLDHDGARLFVERARAAEPSFRLSTVTASSVAEICRRLDGIPLALELAAMRVRGMGVAHLAARLDDRFRLLTGGDRAGEPRQRTLNAAVDWSYNLLSPSERVVMRRLGVFVGDFSLKAAEAVCVDEDAVTERDAIAADAMLDTLTRLVDKSLVKLDQETALYRLLETIRMYCLERLADSNEANYTSRRRFNYYLHLAGEGQTQFGGPGEDAWITQLEQEHDNIRAALTWAIQSGRGDEAARIALGLWKFWHTRTYQAEGLRWLRQIYELDRAKALPDDLRPRLFNALGVMSHSCAHFDDAATFHALALQLWKVQGDRAGEGQALLDMAWQRFDQARLDEAYPFARDALTLAEQVGDARLTGGALMATSVISLESGRQENVIPAIERALAIWRKLGNGTSVASTLALLASAFQRRGDFERSKPLLAESVRLNLRIGAYGDLIGALVGLHHLTALTAGTPEQARDAAQIIGAMKAWEQSKSLTSSPWWESDREKMLSE